MNEKHISVLVDNDSWILPYAERLVQSLIELGYSAKLERSAETIKPSWINFMLGCTRVVDKCVLELNQHNLVVHESALPKGRGFAPMTWQILEGQNIIPICLIEAANEVDSGDIWLRDVIVLNGSELCNEWRARQGEKTLDLCLRFIIEYETLVPTKQEGESSYYSRRRLTDSRLDVDKTLREQFHHLRVVDNEHYPAWFELDGRQYMLHVFKREI